MARVNSFILHILVYAVAVAAIASTFRMGTTTSLARSMRRTSFKMESNSLVPVKAQIPLKIAVAGAGIGGMFLGFTLQSKGFDVTVFEKSAK